MIPEGIDDAVSFGYIPESLTVFHTGDVSRRIAGQACHVSLCATESFSEKTDEVTEEGFRLFQTRHVDRLMSSFSRFQPITPYEPALTTSSEMHQFY